MNHPINKMPVSNLIQSDGRRTFIREVGRMAILPLAASVGLWAAKRCPIALRGFSDSLISTATKHTSMSTSVADLQLLQQARDVLNQELHNFPTKAVEGPISFLQRNLRLGYGKALRLADDLERTGAWTAAIDGRRILLIPDGQ